ncbi:ShlB/FhaC/HecB family hemolysin secretion/activation protein [Pseudomonas putida]
MHKRVKQTHGAWQSWGSLCSQGRWSAVACIGLLSLHPAWALEPAPNTSDLQQLPGSSGNLCAACEPGQSLEPPTPRPESSPAPANAGPTIELREVRFNGARKISPQRLQALAADYIGRPVGLAQLDELAKRVTDLYHREGYFLAQAIVPAQKVSAGVVDITVLEGRLGKVLLQVEPNAPLSEVWVQKYLAPLEPGQPLRSDDYERAMLLLSDQPGVKVRSGLQEGVEPGTTDLVVEVSAADRWSFAVNADNHGTKESGRARAGGSARWASPTGVGDNLDLNALFSNNNGVNYGRVAYDRPLNGDGWRAGVGFSRVEYDLGGAFSELGATGTAYVTEALLSYPLLRQRSQNLLLRARVEQRRLTDRFDEFDYESRKEIYGTGLGWGWERRDNWFGGGYWASNGELYYGHLRFRDSDAEAVDSGPFGLDTAGDFVKLSGNLARLQSMTATQSLYLSIGGQLASRNLDSSEKLALGGAHAVRGYASSEVLVDDGVLSSLEWRWSFSELLTPYLFYDFGRGRQLHDAPFSGDNWQTLSATGVGLVIARPADFLINMSLAWGLNGPGVTDGGDRQPRFFLELQKWF